MPSLIHIQTPPQRNPRLTSLGTIIASTLLTGMILVLGIGCKTLPRYEEPATQDTVFERINAREDKVDRIRWHHHVLINQQFPRKPSIELYIGQSLDRSQTVWLRLRTYWTGRQWQLFNGITINVDGTRYDWNRLDFKRDVRSGISSVYVDENLDIPIDTAKREVIEAIINAESAVVRFRGERGISDFKISPTDRLVLQDILTAFDALQAGAQRSE